MSMPAIPFLSGGAGGGYGIQGSPSTGWNFPGNGYVGIGGSPAAKLDIIGSSNTSSAQQAIRFTDTGSTAAQRDWALGNSIGANYGEFCFYASAAKNGNPLSGGVLVLTLKPDGSTDAAGTIRATGRAAPSAGAGVEVDYSGGVGRVLSYNRTGAAYTPLDLEASLFTFYAEGVAKFTVAPTVNTLAVPLVFPSYTLATLPAAASFTRAQIWVSDMTGGAQFAYSDGTNWRRVSDNTVAS